MPPSVVVINHSLILSRKPAGTALGSSCLKAGTGKTGLVLIFTIQDKYTYICLHPNTPFYEFISHILTFVRFPDFSWFCDFSWLGSGISDGCPGSMI